MQKKPILILNMDQVENLTSQQLFLMEKIIKNIILEEECGELYLYLLLK